MSKKPKTLPCRRCGVDMEPRESFKGCGYCYICAPEFSPTRVVEPESDGGA
jgi:hypothetical protein